MKIPIGLNIDTNDILLAHDLNDDLRGLKCHCVCPGCGARLQARWGPKTKKHFAHYRQVAKDSCGETSLHLLGKHVLSTQTTIQLKAVDLTPEPNQDMLGEKYRYRQVIVFGQAIHIEQSNEEVTIEDVRCDVLSRLSYGDSPLLINFEIKVTHKVDDIKYEKLIKLELNTIEIDLSHLLKLPVITVEEVVEALNDASYQNVINLASCFVESAVATITDVVQSQINARNEFIQQWMNGVNNKLIGNGYTLPINNFDSLQRLDPSNPPPPALDKSLLVRSFTHDSGNRFLLLLANKRQVKLLPIYIITPRSSLLIDDTDYLTMEATLINPKAPKLIANWGRSSLMKTYNEWCRKKLEDKKSKAIERDLQKVHLHLDHVNHLIELDEPLACSNASEIETLAISNYNEMVNNGIAVEKLNVLYSVTTDPFSIYGCPAFHWQTILIFKMHNNHTEDINIKWAASALKSHRIDVVGPFRELAFMSKFIKGQHIELPFNGSYKMLSNYLTHLGSIGFIEPTNHRGRYQLSHTAIASLLPFLREI